LDLLKGVVPPDRWLAWGLGFTALHASVQGFFRGYAESLEGLTLVVMNGLVGLLFFLRRPGDLSVGLAEAGVCLSSVVLSGVALLLAPPLGDWPTASSVAFAVSAAAAAGGLLSLGRSFAVLPSFRGLVSRGPFRIIRHPIYAAELAMVAAALSAASSWLTLAVFLCTFALLVWRIRIEERALEEAPEYEAYQRQVRWRLVPGLW